MQSAVTHASKPNRHVVTVPPEPLVRGRAAEFEAKAALAALVRNIEREGGLAIAAAAAETAEAEAVAAGKRAVQAGHVAAKALYMGTPEEAAATAEASTAAAAEVESARAAADATAEAQAKADAEAKAEVEAKAGAEQTQEYLMTTLLARSTGHRFTSFCEVGR